MLTETGLQELLGYQTQHPVLSVYLNTDPSEGSADAYRLSLRNMLKEVELSDDVAAMEAYFEHEYDWAGRSVAVFSCAPDDFFRAYPIAIPVGDRVRINDHPHVKPLARLLDSYGGYGVVLVDKQGGRLFYFHLGELREQEGIVGESVRRTKRGGSSAVAGRRGGTSGQTNYTDEVTERNMRNVADFAAHFFSENNVRRVLLGGTDDNIALFRGLLPKSWQSLIVGTFPVSMTASKKEVLERAIEIGRQAEIIREERLVDAVITSASKGRGGTLNLDDTLTAVHEGRVQALVIRNGYRAPGYRCGGCEYLTGQLLDTCPFCGETFSQIPDAVEMAVRKAMQHGAEVEVLQRDHVIEGFENIGALLRY